MILLGVEYPVLAILASMVFSIVVFSLLFLHLHVVEEINEVPIISGTAQAHYVNSTTVRLIVTIRNERSKPVDLLHITIYTNREVVNPIQDPNVVVEIIGLYDNKTLLPGSTIYVLVDLPIVYLDESSKQYSVLVVFDSETLVIPFRLMR